MYHYIKTAVQYAKYCVLVSSSKMRCENCGSKSLAFEDHNDHSSYDFFNTGKKHETQHSISEINYYNKCNREGGCKNNIYFIDLNKR